MNRKQPSTCCLRFFDFDVKPKKQYQYRIFLVLEIQITNLPANALEDADLASITHISVGMKLRPRNRRLATNRLPNGRRHAPRTACRATCGCWAGRSPPPGVGQKSTRRPAS